MTTAIVLGMIAVVVLVVVVWLLRRSARDRLMAPGEDLWGSWLRRHRLSAPEADDVNRGVGQGREFDDPRLRAAAADWAAILLRVETPSLRVRRVLGACVAVWLAALVALILVDGPMEANPVTFALWVFWAVWLWRRRRNLRRSIERNSDVPAA